MTSEDIAPPRENTSRWPRFPAGPRRGRDRVGLVLAGVVLVGYAWMDATAAPFSTRALVGVLIPGAVLGAIAYGRPPQRIRPPDEIDPLGMSYWMIAVAALFEWEASAFRDNSRPWHPSLTSLINPLLEPHMMKTAAIVVWMVAGWGLVKR